MATADQVKTIPESIKFKDMSAGQKMVFIVKFIIFLCSFGFAFPTLLND